MNPKVFSFALIALTLSSYFHSFLLTFVDIISLFAVALATALARVAALEAELKITIEALKDAKTTKVSTDKAAKAAETKAKKAEKALAEATQKQAKREQAVVERLDEICTSVGSKCFILSLCLPKVTSIDMLLLTYLYFCDAAEKLGEVWKLRQSAKHPLHLKLILFLHCDDFPHVLHLKFILFCLSSLAVMSKLQNPSEVRCPWIYQILMFPLVIILLAVVLSICRGLLILMVGYPF
jgi:hypothetical protein